ncbi:MAG: hypothetical protein JO302_02755 [Candidatus Eremiobacteraeota bacterium]|nr:hypothetical protein [Candidatus Eremiobacteraeota bacterium]
MKPLPSISSCAVTLSALIACVAASALQAAAQATPPPPPPALGTSLPTPSATLAPLANPNATSSPSPPPDARKGIEGVWEVQIQHVNATDYTHLKLVQTGSALAGTYLDRNGKRYPLSGSLDGQDVRLVVSMPNGTTMLLEGRLDGTTDMVGMLTTDKEQVPFTAAYRAKEKWIENVNASPGGIGTPNGGYTPP